MQTFETYNLVFAKYYLAHLNHQNAKFDQAIIDYEYLINNLDQLNSVGGFDEEVVLRFNLILCQFAMDQDKTGALMAIQKLDSGDQAIGTDLLDAMKQLTDDLNQSSLFLGVCL